MNSRRDNLKSLFDPQSIAFIGATRDEGKWGFIILRNMVSGGFKGRIYPLNPHCEGDILKLKVYPDLSSLPETPDLAVVVVPQPQVLPVIRECAQRQVKAAIIITAGFAEAGNEEYQAEIVSVARRGGMVVVGPNCNGIVSVFCKLNILMAGGDLFKGVTFIPRPISLITQSGNVGASLLRRALTLNTGFGRYISIGNEADVTAGELLEYLGQDEATRVILLYLEGIHKGRDFFNVSTRVSKVKPIVALKSGKTIYGMRAARSHTAALSGSDEVFNSLCRQGGIIRVEDIDQLFYIGTSLLYQPLPQGRKVAIITLGGGWGVLGSDAIASEGLELADLPSSTISRIDRLLPWWWSHQNPIDTVAGMRKDTLINLFEALLSCPTVDSVLLLAGTSSSLPLPWDEFILHMVELRKRYSKPIVFSSELVLRLMETEEIVKRLGDSGVIPLPSINMGAKVLSALAFRSEYLRR